MRARLHSKLLAALLLPALLASGAAQGLLFMRCGATVRMSCCCPKEAAPAPTAALKPGALQCCDKLAVPSVPAQTEAAAAPSLAGPMLVAAPGPSSCLAPAVERLPIAPALDPPPGPSPVLANCALLI